MTEKHNPLVQQQASVEGLMPESAEESAEEFADLAARAHALGFVGFGVSAPHLSHGARERLRDFVACGQHGTMAWFAHRLEERLDPQKLWGEARSAIVLAAAYTPDGDAHAAWRQSLDDKGLAGIALYARGQDYHEVVKKRLKIFARWLCEAYKTEAKVFTDTAPLSEKTLAAQAGLGWIGKNTQLVSRSHGCWLLLGVVLTARAFAPQSFSENFVKDSFEGSFEDSSSTRDVARCGSCRRCLDVCPTKAFVRPYVLDARRCLSYMTIEHRGAIPREFRAAMGNRVFGCDDCLAVCPWNKFARASREVQESAERAEEGAVDEDSMSMSMSMGTALRSRRELGAGRIAAWLRLSEAEFRHLFRKTAVKRLKIAGFRRNLLVALGNSGERALLPQAEQALQDADAAVRVSAVWAVWRLGGRERVRALAEHGLRGETDEEVREEWHLCMQECAQE